MRTRILGAVGAVAVVAALVVAAVTVVGGPSRPAPFDAWPDSTFGAVVVDRDTGVTRFEYRAHEQFRAASLVKLVIALDVLERPAPAAPDRTLVDSMLRFSDDDAASVLWARMGGAEIVRRTAARLGLADTEPPAGRSSWGYTATSASDVARVYLHLLGAARPDVRDAVLGALRATTRCAVDGRDQQFGVASGPGAAAKQGWSGFGEVPAGTGCAPAPRSAVDPGADDRARAELGPVPDDTRSDPDIDTTSPAAHTSGVVGERGGAVVVVLSLHPDDTAFDDATGRLDTIVRALLTPPTPRP